MRTNAAVDPATTVTVPAEDLETLGVAPALKPTVERCTHTVLLSQFQAAAIDVVNGQERMCGFSATQALRSAVGRERIYLEIIVSASHRCLSFLGVLFVIRSDGSNPLLAVLPVIVSGYGTEFVGILGVMLSSLRFDDVLARMPVFSVIGLDTWRAVLLHTTLAGLVRRKLLDRFFLLTAGTSLHRTTLRAGSA